MKLIDQYRFVRQNMRKNKSRLFMTILATAMGCCFLIVLASVGFGVQESVTREITSNGNVTEITVMKKMQKAEVTDEDFLFKEEEVRWFSKIEHVEAVVQRNIPGAAAEYRLGEYQSESTHNTVFVNMKEEVKGKLELSEGRFPEGPDEVLAGYHFAELLRHKDHAEEEYRGSLLNQTMTIQFTQPGTPAKDGSALEEEPETFTLQVKIVGVKAKPGREWMQDTGVMLDHAAAEGGYGVLFPGVNMEGKFAEVKVFADDMKHVTAIADEIQTKPYHTYSVLSELKQVDNVFLFIKIGLLFVGAIAILIAAIGIFNTMTMAVTERTQEIGIMKAIGASPSSIRSIFLLESSYIGLVGTLIGTIVAYLVSWVVNLVIPAFIASRSGGDDVNLTFSTIPVSLVLIAALLSVGVAVLSGMRPAARATNIDVLKALRRDI